jgi:PAS domain S-box-containing protein
VYDARLLREILDAQSEMLCRFRRDGTILFVNRAYAEMIASTPGELTGRCLWDFVSPEDRAHVETQIDTLSPENPFVRIENRFETVSGPRWTMWRNSAVSFDENGQWVIAQSTGVDITTRKQLEEHRQLLIDELNHRVRNTLMVVQGLAHQTFRGSDIPQAPLLAFNARLHALAAAHTALSRSNWAGTEVGEVVAHGLAFCGDDIRRVSRDGPAVALRPNAAVALVLVLHELATNAVKYGALSDDAGQVAIGWSVEQVPDEMPVLHLHWIESDGPPVAPPTRHGFGSRLVTTSIERQMGGAIALDYAPGGLVCRMSFPLREEAA